MITPQPARASRSNTRSATKPDACASRLTSRTWRRWKATSTRFRTNSTASAWRRAGCFRPLIESHHHGRERGQTSSAREPGARASERKEHHPGLARSSWNHPGAKRSRVPVGTSRGKGSPTAGGARRTGRGPGLGGSRAKKNPPERAFKGEAHVGAERGLRAHNVLAAREFRAGQKFFEVIEARDLALEITQCRSRGQASEYMIISFIRYSVRVCMGVKSHS